MNIYISIAIDDRNGDGEDRLRKIYLELSSVAYDITTKIAKQDNGVKIKLARLVPDVFDKVHGIAFGADGTNLDDEDVLAVAKEIAETVNKMMPLMRPNKKTNEENS